MAHSRMDKKCERCGATSRALPRERRCRVRVGLLGTYCCWGRLVPVQKEARMGHASARPQEVAARKLEAARRKVVEKERAIVDLSKSLGRAAKALREWQAKANRYARRASMTDVEVAAERAARVQREAERRARRVRRGIRIERKEAAS